MNTNVGLSDADLRGLRVDRVETLIIGSGVAGVATAIQLLSDNPRRSVVMLEAGPKVEMRNFRMWQDFLITGKAPYLFCQDADFPERDHPGSNRSVGRTVIPVQGSRLLTYGGSTVHWGGWSFRMRPEDFQLRTNTGNGGDWAFSYEHLEPFYCDAEHFLGVSGDSADPIVPRSRPFPYAAFPFTYEDELMLGALRERGMMVNHLPIARYGVTGDGSVSHAPCQTTGTCKYCPYGARFVASNTLDDFLAAGDYPSFTSRTHAVVERLLMDGKRRVRGAVYMDTTTHQRVVVEAETVVVAAGALESPKLLLRSATAEWPKGVGNDNDLVGRYFFTHPYFIIQADLPANPKKFQVEMDLPTLCSRHFDNPAEQAAGKFIMVQTPSAPGVPLKTLMMQGHTRADLDAAVVGPAVLQIHGMVEIFGEHKNRVTNLPGHKNQFGMIETVVDYTQAPGFDARMGEIVGHISELLRAMGGQNPTLQQPVSWRADHAASTVRMGHTPDEGVVDGNLKVFGVDNLFVCSNGVMPSLGCVNPTLTLTALALRLGDHLVALGAGSKSDDSMAQYNQEAQP